MSATPEIQRTDLSTVLLQLIAMRQNPVEFPFISPVPRDACENKKTRVADRPRAHPLFFAQMSTV